MKMKRYILLFIFICVGIVSYSQTQQCRTCNGYGKLYCNTCAGGGVVYQQVYDPYYGIYQNVPYKCATCNGYGVLICSHCGGSGYVQNTPNINFEGGDWIPVKKDVSKCKGHAGSLCSCKKYIGYKKAGREYYQGNCENYVNGHKCGHRPEAHGLNK